MIAFLNGQFLPEEDARVPVSDRGFLYGDGLFEAVRVHRRQLFLWEPHLDRLLEGARSLGFPLHLGPEALRSAAGELITRNALDEGIVRIHVSRGTGRRGYSPRGADQPTWVMTAHPSTPFDGPPPAPWSLATASIRVPAADPLAAFKTTSKIAHVWARAEAEARGADEALLLNTDGHVAETSSANLFWFDATGVQTPRLGAGGLKGTTRGFVRDVVQTLHWTCTEVAVPPESLLRATGAFVTLCSAGLVEVSRIDDQPMRFDPRFVRLRAAFMEAVPGQLSG